MRREIILIGDSLIEYFDWAARFPDAAVHNLGWSGETVQWLLDRLPRVVREHPRADAVFIQTGINNVAMGEPGIIEPYRKVISSLKDAYPGASIYVTSLLPTLLDFLPNAEIDRLNALIKAMADERGARYIDIAGLFYARGLGDVLSPDGIHLSAEGYRIWSDAIAPLVEGA